MKLMQCTRCHKRTTKDEAANRKFRTDLCEFCGWPLEVVIDRRVVAAAIRWEGVNYTGDRHGNIMQYLVKIGVLHDIENQKVKYEHQGFIDQEGVFMSREEARVFAIFNKQVKPNHGTLYSEDLW